VAGLGHNDPRVPLGDGTGRYYDLAISRQPSANTPLHYNFPVADHSDPMRICLPIGTSIRAMNPFAPIARALQEPEMAGEFLAERSVLHFAIGGSVTVEVSLRSSPSLQPDEVSHSPTYQITSLEMNPSVAA
jgi:hypothetical protein